MSAAMMRSRLSRTAPSGSPTTVQRGMLGSVWVSISMGSASTPRTARLQTRDSMWRGGVPVLDTAPQPI